MTVKCFGRDPVTNRFRISRKALIPISSTYTSKRTQPDSDDLEGMKQLIYKETENE